MAAVNTFMFSGYEIDTIVFVVVPMTNGADMSRLSEMNLCATQANYPPSVPERHRAGLASYLGFCPTDVKSTEAPP